MKKIFVENKLKRSERAMLMLMFRYQVHASFRWFGFGKYKIDPRLIGAMKGNILVAAVPEKDSDFFVASLNQFGLNSFAQTSHLPSIFENIFRSWKGFLGFVSSFFILFTIYFLAQACNIKLETVLLLSSVLLSLFAFLLIVPKIIQSPVKHQELEESLALVRHCETNPNAAKTSKSVAAIFPSPAFRYGRVWLFLMVSLSWIFAALFYGWYYPDFSFLPYLGGATMAFGSALVLNHRILNHEISWIVNSEFLAIYSNIWWGPTLVIPISEVLEFTKEKGRVRINFSSGNISLFVNGPEEIVNESVEWSNQLLRNVTSLLRSE